MTHPYFARTRHPRILAHRGLISDPEVWENSVGAFAAAHAAGVEYIETDCRLTSDGSVVLFHDDTLERLTGDPRPVDAVSSTELRELFAPHGGLLTLAEALETFPDTRFNIDVKTPETAAHVGSIVAPHVHRVLITSFSDATRRAAVAAILAAGASDRPAASAGRTAMVRVRAAAAFGWRAPARRALLGIDALQIPERYGALRLLTPRLLDRAHESGVEVHIWTVNDEAEMQRLVAAGADGIVTDRADLAVGTLWAEPRP